MNFYNDFDFLGFITEIYTGEDDNQISVNISSSFLPRARCKICGNGPSWYFFKTKTAAHSNATEYRNRSKYKRKAIKHVNSNHYAKGQPRWYKISDYATILKDKSYRTVLHRNFGANRLSAIDEFLSCECGSTNWGFSRKSLNKRLESVNRRGRYNYPQRF